MLFCLGVWLFYHIRILFAACKLVWIIHIQSFSLKHEQTIRAAVECQGVVFTAGLP